MNPNDFNNAFFNQMTDYLPPPPHDPRFIAHEIMYRDQWRTRILAILSLFFWLIGTVGMMLLVIGLNRFVVWERIKDMHIPAGSTQSTFITPEQKMFWGTDLIHHSMPYVGGSIISLLLAAFFTVLLIFSSRQATLNRINISLMQMSEQLKQMQEKGNARSTRTDERA
ncbi:MAG TPA: hypothetical protein VHS31_19595 [Tepidisphaeraceae bacterium]|jgi:hypothetical protein|nr:hypothetical protein [Tepidisphaeraceae bacterium]